MNRILLVAVLLYFDIFYNSSLAQSLREEAQVQKKQDEIKKQRTEDEEKIAEIEKSKNSIPRNILADKGYQISLDSCRSADGTNTVDSRSFKMKMAMYFIDLVIFDSDLLYVQNCNSRNKEEKYCASKIGSVAVEQNIIKFNRFNNLAKNLKTFHGDIYELTDWEFDMKSNSLYLKIENRIHEFNHCTISKWRDQPSY